MISPKAKQHSQNYSNVFNTFKKVQEIQRKKPALSPTNIYRLIKRKKKDEEHQSNLNAQKKRIQDITSLSNRRKNPSDYLLFPTFLFRRKTISEQVALTPSPKKKGQEINIYSLHQPVDYVDSHNEQTVLLFDDPIKMPYNQSIKHRKKPQLFPYSTA